MGCVAQGVAATTRLSGSLADSRRERTQPKTSGARPEVTATTRPRAPVANVTQRGWDQPSGGLERPGGARRVGATDTTHPAAVTVEGPRTGVQARGATTQTHDQPVRQPTGCPARMCHASRGRQPTPTQERMSTTQHAWTAGTGLLIQGETKPPTPTNNVSNTGTPHPHTHTRVNTTPQVRSGYRPLVGRWEQACGLTGGLPRREGTTRVHIWSRDFCQGWCGGGFGVCFSTVFHLSVLSCGREGGRHGG